MSEVRNAILEVLAEQHPATCRGLFYALVSRGVIDKTEAQYKSTVVRLAGEMRLSGELPYAWLADNTRWMRKPRTWSSYEEALRSTAQLYRRNIWQAQDAYVEIWLEKDALAGVVYDVTETWDVPLMVTRGYPSLTYLHDAAEAIKSQGKPAYLYYFGDCDPSGRDIPRATEQRLRQMAPGVELHFEVVAVTDNQVVELNLPTRPTKKTDSRSRGFAGESVELDAIPAPILRDLVKDCIDRHVDDERLDATLAAEDSEREILEHITQMRFQPLDGEVR